MTDKKLPNDRPRVPGLEAKPLTVFRGGQWDLLTGVTGRSPFEMSYRDFMPGDSLGSAYFAIGRAAEMSFYDPLRDAPHAYLELGQLGIKALERDSQDDGQHLADVQQFYRDWGPLYFDFNAAPAGFYSVEQFWSDARELGLVLLTKSSLSELSLRERVRGYHIRRLDREIQMADQGESRSGVSKLRGPFGEFLKRAGIRAGTEEELPEKGAELIEALRRWKESALSLRERMRQLPLHPTSTRPALAGLPEPYVTYLSVWLSTEVTGHLRRNDALLELASPGGLGFDAAYSVKGLRGAIWIQVWQALIAGSRFRSCANQTCGRLFSLNTEREQKYCSKTCKAQVNDRAKYQKRKQRLQMSAALKEETDAKA